MRLRPDCGGCERDSNDPTFHAPHCNYSKWPGLYDTIEEQKRTIRDLEQQIFRDRDDRRADRHTVALCRALDRQFENAGGALSDDKIAEIVRRARLAADLAYPPPKAEEPHG